MNPYEILGVSEDASIEEISDIFRALAKKYHPDRAKNEREKEENASKFVLLTQAYNAIKNNNIKIRNGVPDEVDEDKNYEQIIVKKAKYFIAREDYNSAIRILKRIKGKHHHEASMLMGEAYLRKERYHEALKYFRVAYNEKPWNMNAKFKMAYVYEKINLKNTAKKMYEEILSMDSANERAMSRLAALRQKKFSLRDLFGKG